MDEVNFTLEETIEELESIKRSLIKDVTTYSRRIDEIINNLKRTKGETNHKGNQSENIDKATKEE